jgi:hypothetical protein
MGKRNPLMERLDHIRKRPLMYFSDQVPAVVNFLEGFTTAWVMLYPVSDFYSIREQVIREHGWEQSATPIWQQMKERGMDDAAIIDEMLAIYYEIWTRDTESTRAIKNSIE